MKILHLTWQNVANGFDNPGKLYLWIEATAAIHKQHYYPYQLGQKELLTFAASFFKDNQFIPTTVQGHVPCNLHQQPIPSPIIANLHDVEMTNAESVAEYNFYALEIISILEFLKNLNFASYYFDRDIQLAGDAQFWIKMGYEISRIIKTDQYCPDMVAHKTNLSYYWKWQPLSAEYNHRLESIVSYMPYSACMAQEPYEKKSTLQHFSEVVLTQFVNQTSFPQKITKSVEGTLLEDAISCKKNVKVVDELWQQWAIWRNKLAYDQLGAAFKLVFKLNAPEQENHPWEIEILLQSQTDLGFVVNLEAYQANKEKQKKLYQKMFGTSIDRMLLLQLGYACRIYSLVEKFFSHQLKQATVQIAKDEAYQFLKADAWSLHACGYRIIVPSWWTHKGRLKAKVKLRASQRKSNKKDPTSPNSYLSYESLVNFDYGYAIGNTPVSKAEWQALLKASSELVYFRGQWLEIDQEEMQKIEILIKSAEQDKSTGNIHDLIEMASQEDSFDVDVDDNLENMLHQLINKDAIQMIAAPARLLATLRPYQERGLSWLAYLESLGMNPCLADDMGLGKTMQIIALLLSRPVNTPGLLVAPTSVIGNWEREIKHFAPTLNTYVYHGAQRKQDNFYTVIKDCHLVITSFGLLRQDKAIFQEQHWSRIIVDEAQNIKNSTTSQTKVLCSLQSDSRIALTGTPVENRLMDLWSIFNFLNPGYLGTKTFFRKSFELPIQKENEVYARQVLKKMVEPFILRRVKTDKNIIKDLPDKIEQKVYCQLTKEQAVLYQSIVDSVTERLENSAEKAQKAIFLASLLKLKQVCNHPAQFLQDNSDFHPNRSVKLQRLLDMATEIISNGESLLLFTQFTEMASKLETFLRKKQGFATYYLHGGTAQQKRIAMIEQFQKSESPPAIFILSLKAGGTGITLTKANHVIHFDRWWNPAVENQATDRAYRIGQQKAVFVHKYITLGTIEETIDKMLVDKQKISDQIIGHDESWLTNLDAKSFLDLIKLKSTMVV